MPPDAGVNVLTLGAGGAGALLMGFGHQPSGCVTLVFLAVDGHTDYRQKCRQENLAWATCASG